MSRIRSIHPGLFTDENYMAISIPARELIKGLWCEADDQGVFQWKPYTIKARIFPADAVSVDALLAELEAGDFIRAFDVDGRKYGAIRNFRKYQRPKKPHCVFFLPQELREYVCLSPIEQNQGDKLDPVPPLAELDPLKPAPVPQKGEQPPQREDGGGRREEKVSKESPVGEVVLLPRARGTRADGYTFEGKIIRLTKSNLEEWRKSFAKIRSIEAELCSLDAWLVEHKHDGPWFHKVAGMLARKCQEIGDLEAKRKTWPGGVIPMHKGAGG